jgi:hypothetical protein
MTAAVILAAPISGQGAPMDGSWSSPTSVISPVVMASWFTTRAPNGVEQLELLVLWRGTPGWFLHPGGSGGSGGGPASSHTWITRIRGDRTLTLTLDYDPPKRLVVVQGTRLELAGNNVVFVDDVDSSDGPRVTRTTSIARAMPGSPGQIGLVLRNSPEIMSFLRCDSAPSSGPSRPLLEHLCLQNVGVISSVR